MCFTSDEKLQRNIQQSLGWNQKKWRQLAFKQNKLKHKKKFFRKFKPKYFLGNFNFKTTFISGSLLFRKILWIQITIKDLYFYFFRWRQDVPFLWQNLGQRLKFFTQFFSKKFAKNERYFFGFLATIWFRYFCYERLLFSMYRQRKRRVSSFIASQKCFAKRQTNVLLCYPKCRICLCIFDELPRRIQQSLG